MTSPQTTLAQASIAFVRALADYQVATRDMNLALGRMQGHLSSLYGSLQTVVSISGSMLPPRR